ncbi:hypothetical protein N0K73_05350 [Dellaglioa algida]|uniref:hypothetical protein n=1 Tax=Dellaglioa algida TaxID=105612 RepID=UPI0024C4A3B4|nr:hypothetical protein [Dellaglioa algida]MDK1716614.1 hypothetical protein [Dellaglioa algida]MDK1718697.1 hypothetical protein [Dellaglioa algida]
MHSFSENHPLLLWTIKVIIAAISFVGITTIFEAFVYFSNPYSYEKISIIQLSDENRDDYLRKTHSTEMIDLTTGHENSSIEYLIGPEENVLDNISLLRFYAKSGKIDDFRKEDVPRIPKELAPQNYLYLKVPVSEAIPLYKMTFMIHNMPGEYTFSENLKNGFNNQETLKVKKTITSFFDK